MSENHNFNQYADDDSDNEKKSFYRQLLENFTEIRSFKPGTSLKDSNPLTENELKNATFFRVS